jgi:transposase-like protein
VLQAHIWKEVLEELTNYMGFWCRNSAGARIEAMTFAEHLFKRRHFDRLVIILCVRWYVRYKLSYRDLVELMAERGLAIAHTTIMRWVVRFVPVLEQRWQRYALPVGRSWRVDETYIKIKGRWAYLYRAVDKQGRTVDFYLSERRDIAAAKAFLHKAIGHHGTPDKITLDGYPASHRAVEDLREDKVLPADMLLRSCQYLNNIVEQDHRGIKCRTGPMLGFKRFDHAAIVIAGIELARKITKGQFNFLPIVPSPGRSHDWWAAVVGA